MPPAGGSALIGRFNDTSPIGSFETDKEQANEANSKDVLVFSWNFSNETTAVLPRWTEIFFPWEIVTKLQKRRRSTKKQTGARKRRNFLRHRKIMNRIDTAGEDRNSRTKKAPKDYKTNYTPRQEENDQISAEFKVGSWQHHQKIKQPSERQIKEAPRFGSGSG